MIRPLWTVLCDKVLVNEQNQSISCIDMIGAVAASKLPKELPFFMICTSWEEDEEKPFDFDVKITFSSEDGTILKQAEHQVKAGASRFISVNLELKGIKVNNLGRHIFKIEYKNKRERKWKLASESPLYIVAAK